MGYKYYNNIMAMIKIITRTIEVYSNNSNKNNNSNNLIHACRTDDVFCNRE